MILPRLAGAAVTLLLLSMAVFLGTQVLPGDVGRAILGPLADPAAVAALDRQLGADRPALALYWAWVSHAAAGDFGQSYAFRTPVGPLVAGALANSLKLSALVLAIVVPLSMAAGVYAAARAYRWQDRALGAAGVSLAVVPEFVSGLVLVLVLGVWLRWLPISAATRPGAGALDQLRHLVLPALPLVVVLFGYLARIVRAGALEALEADYTRTAVLKGLPRRVVILRHVLRNALVPAVAVAAAQLGYMIGGLVVVETLFRYQGVGSLILNAAKARDFPVLEGAVLAVGAVTVLASLAADGIAALLDPRRLA